MRSFAAISFGLESLRPVIELQEAMQAQVGKPKRPRAGADY